MKRCLASILLLYAVSLFGQEQPLGTWRDHPSFKDIYHITGSDDLLFAAADFGMFSYRKGQSANIIRQRDGLSSTQISTMLFLENFDGLLVGYQTGEIDFVGQQEIITETSLTQLDSRLEKTLYDITIINDKAYFASDLGVVEYELEKKSARDIFRNIGDNATPVSAYQILSTETDLFVFTEVGLLRGSIEKNLLDFTQWEQLNNFPYTSSVTAGIINETIVYSIGDLELKRIRLDGASLDDRDFNRPILQINDQGGRLLIVTENEVWDISSSTPQVLYSSSTLLKSAFFQEDLLWVGTESNGLLDVLNNVSILPKGPETDFPIRVSSVGERLYLSNGQEKSSYYSDNSWSIADVITDVALFGTDTLILNATGELIMHTGQLIEIPILNGTPTDLLIVEDVLWVASNQSQTPLISTQNLTEWEEYSSNQVGVSSLSKLSISQGNVLYGMDDLNRVIAFDPFDGSSRILDSRDGINGDILDYKIDLDDALYIASSDGLYYANDATFIFNQDELSTAFISEGNLLSTDNFTAIEIDPGNRKWLATTDGLWLYNSSLSEQLAYYSEENSFLPSNNITEIHLQSANGLLWLSTAAGLTSFQTDAIQAQPFHENVKIFPNPISISRDNRKVGITGITANAKIKITTLAGRYINEIDGYGSMTSWDLSDAYGQVVTPGIYLFFSSDLSGDETFVGKILVEP